MGNTLLSVQLRVNPRTWNPPSFYSRLNHITLISQTVKPFPRKIRFHPQLHSCASSLAITSVWLRWPVHKHYSTWGREICKERGGKMDQTNLIRVACKRFIQDIAQKLASRLQQNPESGRNPNWSEIRPEVWLNHNFSGYFKNVCHFSFSASLAGRFSFWESLLFRNSFIKTTLFNMKGTNQWERANPPTLSFSKDPASLPPTHPPPPPTWLSLWSGFKDHNKLVPSADWYWGNQTHLLLPWPIVWKTKHPRETSSKTLTVQV